MKNVRSGDVISIGEKTPALHLVKTFRLEPSKPVIPDRFTLISLEEYFNASPPRDWWSPATFAGIIRGTMYSGGIPYHISDKNKWAIRCSKDWTEVRLKEQSAAGELIYFFGSGQGTDRQEGFEVKVEYSDGTSAMLTLEYCGIADTGWPLGQGAVQVYSGKLDRNRQVTGIHVRGDFLIFAVTIVHC